MKKIILWIAVSILLLLVLIYIIAWKSPVYYVVSTGNIAASDSIIPFKDYSNIIDHPRPYIINYKNVLTVFGAEHTRDPNHIEIPLIEEEWNKLKPTVALVEGRLDFHLPLIMNPVENLGEGGKVKELSSKAGIPIYNWDLSKEDLAKRLVKYFEPEQIAIAQILSPYFGELRHSRPSDPEKFIEEYIDRAEYVGEEKNIQTAEDVDRIWKKYFQSEIDWRNVDDQYGLPGFLAEIATITNDLRNHHLVNVIHDLLQKGERVFVICGSSHAACIAPAFQR